MAKTIAPDDLQKGKMYVIDFRNPKTGALETDIGEFVECSTRAPRPGVLRKWDDGLYYVFHIDDEEDNRRWFTVYIGYEFLVSIREVEDE